MAKHKDGDPRLDSIFAIKNGFAADPIAGAAAKREGVRAGVPDLCLPVPSGQYGALYIEMKTLTGKLSLSQKQWHSKLQKQGNSVLICQGSKEAALAIAEYLGIKNPFPTA